MTESLNMKRCGDIKKNPLVSFVLSFLFRLFEVLEVFFFLEVNVLLPASRNEVARMNDLIVFLETGETGLGEPGRKRRRMRRRNMLVTSKGILFGKV